ncbi:transposase, partial [Paenactinomyces guangxiensis]|uniref:transposase n=1 Tax=Paenactinomyces guangxiensis TaxID=1490290 RepID=UPI00361DD9B9
MSYLSSRRIYSFRELEWKLNQDHWARRCIGLDEVPDHSTFCRRAKQIEEGLY